jgi:peptide/nickel transport system ATP-binding protein
VVESAPVRELFRSPRHPYTKALLDCLPARAAVGADGRRVVRSIPGQVGPVDRGCAFAPRCVMAQARCGDEAPAIEADGARLMRCLRWREFA